MHVGLAGAGLLGSALGERFAAAGFAVKVFDPNSSRLPDLEGLGCRIAASVTEAAQFGDIVVLSLPDSRVSAAVLDEIRPVWRPEQILIDTTTGDPVEMREMSQGIARYIDATVAGSSDQVRAREVVVLAGGAAADVEEAAPLFDAFAERTFHVGGRGAGASMKLIVNLVLGLHRAVLAEGLTLARAMGLDPDLTLEVLRASPAYSVAMDRKGTKMLQRDWSPEARLRQHHKDVRLILGEAERHQIALPLSELHDRLLSRAEELGFGDADNSAILEAFLAARR
jgi:3-hydroxyisobutyrate dehydrogenase-like beta-hydroxyacid dehydrogenase